MNNTKTRIAAILAVLLILFSYTGCTSTSKGPSAPRQPDEHYLGNFDPFQLENVMSITKNMKGDLNPHEMAVYFAPRKNTVEFRFQYGMDKILLSFDLAERNAFYEGIVAYMEAYNAGNLPERAPTRKNFFTRTPVTVSWGVISYGYTAASQVRTNYEYLEPGKPYFVATFESSLDKSSNDSYSPTMNIYFTPSQLEKLVEIIDQDEFQARVDELNVQAFEW